MNYFSIWHCLTAEGFSTPGLQLMLSLVTK